MIDLRGLPDFLTRKQLVEIGLFTSGSVEWRARKAHMGPRYIMMGHNIMYPKKFLIKFLDNNQIDYVIEEDNEL